MSAKILLDSISRQKKTESFLGVTTMQRGEIILQKQIISLMLLEIVLVKLSFALIGKDRITQRLARMILIGAKDSVIIYSLRPA